MKELTQEHRETEIVIVSEQQQRKELKLLGRNRKIKGHTLWEFNIDTKELIPAKFKPMGVMISSSLQSTDTTRTYSVVTNEKCLYFQSLNRSNAERKLRKAKLL